MLSLLDLRFRRPTSREPCSSLASCSSLVLPRTLLERKVGVPSSAALELGRCLLEQTLLRDGRPRRLPERFVLGHAGVVARRSAEGLWLLARVTTICTSIQVIGLQEVGSAASVEVEVQEQVAHPTRACGVSCAMCRVPSSSGPPAAGRLCCFDNPAFLATALSFLRRMLYYSTFMGRRLKLLQRQIVMGAWLTSSGIFRSEADVLDDSHQ